MEGKCWEGLPPARGLYDPTLEKDSCGVGAIANLSGVASHEIVRDGIEILERMAHRGACGCDERSGDGAGILIAIPDSFYRRTLKQSYGVDLPPKGQYATGLIFLPQDFDLRETIKRQIEQVIENLEQVFIVWRTVPTNNQQLGPTSRGTEPWIEQIFIENPEESDKGFERNMYLIRKACSNDSICKDKVYFCSLSSRTIIYKGQFTPAQVDSYYIDIGQKDFSSHFIMVHSRFSTNTFPSWERAQPMRVMCHNGEINTLRGNTNWMKAREGVMESKIYGPDIKRLFPIINTNTSDSGAFDNCLEFLMHAGRNIEEGVCMMVPEPWEKDTLIDPDKEAFYEYNSHLMEPWDGPAYIAFTDGFKLGAVLDRNGLRPGRYVVTKQGKVILGSEVGILEVPDDEVTFKGRLTPGEMFLIDFNEGRIVSDKEIKYKLAKANPYKKWLKRNRIFIPPRVDDNNRNNDIISREEITFPFSIDPDLTMDEKLRTFGYTVEVMEMLTGPMAAHAYETLGSMGNDTAPAYLSSVPQHLYSYFQQMFAQVTNPPIDPIRENIVMSLMCPIGPEGNLLEISENHCARLSLIHPVINGEEWYHLTHQDREGWSPAFLDMTFPREEGPGGLKKAVKRLCTQTVEAIKTGHKLVILSDKGICRSRVPVDSLLAVGAVHQYLVKHALRSQVGLIVQSGNACEVHHHCLLVGFGADAIYPWVVYEACWQYQEESRVTDPIPYPQLEKNYQKGVHKGMLKVMAKMGISTIQSYKGAQIFEALGVGQEIIDMCFTGCQSRIGGGNFESFAKDLLRFHTRAFPLGIITDQPLPNTGQYHWRSGVSTENHLNIPNAIATLQDSARTNSVKTYKKFAKIYNEQVSKCTLRGQFRLKEVEDSIPIEQVEPAKDIVKRFQTGAMSYGSLSIEAHSTLAMAMNRIGGKSNTGEGGEHISRYDPTPDGYSTRSAIKQVASGRFGVSIYYLTNSDEIQIKMAQGAKPGEGGELPGHKVAGEIAATRRSTPGVGLISPPPHHDIYSIEDLAQLIFDLKNSNPTARISVKLVSVAGVGVIASGVAKGKADHILISGATGGTGAAKWTGIKHAGMPWELGLAEAHQVLVQNGLRSRVCLATDGQIKTGLDLLKASLLGAEEYCMSTGPLMALGCIMMRKCHLNTCPVGIATQDPELRKKFSGQPEHVVNYLFMMAEEMRGYMARLGISTVDKLIGRTDLLEVIPQHSEKGLELDFSKILLSASTLNPDEKMIKIMDQDHGLDEVLDRAIIKRIGSSLKSGKKVRADFHIKNLDRATGSILSYEVTKKFGRKWLPDGTIHLRFKGSAGQSFGAWLAHGITMELNGDANDYVGKGLSGGKLIIYPPKAAMFRAEDNMIVGNVVLYGATSGTAFIRGRAAQRFCVRNSGAHAVVEGVGDHCCEYMTGGIAIILGPIGRNFAAGMSGGIAFVWDPEEKLQKRCNLGLVQLENVEDKNDINQLKDLIDQHRSYTGSAVADYLLWNWDKVLTEFIKVIPTDYKRVMTQRKLKNALQNKLLAQTSNIKENRKQRKQNAKDIEDILSSEQTPGRPKSSSAPIKRRGFIEYERGAAPYRENKERVEDFKEIYTPPDRQQLKTQAARCMDCGVPFCHQEENGCPLSNKIPEWNDLVYKDRWREALDRLLETNNFPEFTGRACPAPCEGSCVLGIIENPVTIKNIECTIIDHAWEQGWMVPNPPKSRSGKKIAIVGSGPAGLACADQLNKAGHSVTVYERADRIGGLLMYGVPNMKLDKKLVVNRRVNLMKAEGVQFIVNTEIGKDISATQLMNDNDALVLATGATRPRDLPIPGRNLKGIDFAMTFLTANTKSYLDSQLSDGNFINAEGKNVIVIGGGDTGNDCIGTSVRHKAKSVVNFELLPQPPKARASGNPWPLWPLIFRTDYGQDEVIHKYGKDPREFSILSKNFVDDGQGNVTGINTVKIEWTKNHRGEFSMKEVENSSETYKADLVLLAMGFLGPEAKIALELKLNLDRRGNYAAAYGEYRSSVDGVYACGDCRRGQSLIVRAIAEGRQCARQVDIDLMGKSDLP